MQIRRDKQQRKASPLKVNLKPSGGTAQAAVASRLQVPQASP